VGLTVVILLFVGVAAFFIVRQATVVVEPTEVLPSHLGLFQKSQNGQLPVEIRPFEAASVSDGRNILLADGGMQKLNSQPEFVLYADSAEVPLSDLKLIRIDSVTDDGHARFADFQAAIIDQRPTMKRIMLPQPLPSGRYAFAMFSGFYNEGRHRFWAFEVSAGNPSGMKFEQELTITLKPPTTPLVPTLTDLDQIAVDPIPPGSTVAYCNATDVRIRAEAGRQGKIKGKLLKGQKVYVINYAYPDVNGVAETWARVQTESGKQGWVFNSFLDHGKN